MHVAIGGLITVAAQATPTPVRTPPASEVTPGPLGFLSLLFLAILVIALLWDMQRRLRRARYRAEVREELDAEEEAARAADAGNGHGTDRPAPGAPHDRGTPPGGHGGRGR